MGVATGKTVLFADDEENMRKVLERRLTAWGCRPIAATNSLDAVRLARERRPDLILLDDTMPGLTGLAACHQLKLGEDTRHIPVLVLTARDSRTLAAEVRTAGADGFLQKPFEFTELLQLIEGALAQPQPLRS